jgi:acyl-coenzyme A synthetase/AMP-(fatty) acid ligase
VAQVSVFGHRDTRCGEVAWARIVPRDAEADDGLLEEIAHLCRERLADYKVPQSMELVASLPKTASGKLVRREIAT